MKYRNVFMGSISALAGILLIILAIINSLVVRDGFLKYTNHKYKVEKTLLMSAEELDKVTEKMVAYVKGQIESPQIIVEIRGAEVEFFNDKELKHLLDVRELMDKLYGAMVIMFIVCVVGEWILIKRKAYSAMINGLYGGWGILIAFSLGIGVVALVDIDIVITGFHQMFLADSNWILNPSLDRSVWMFMTNMYQDVLIAIAAIVVAVAIVTIITVSVVKKHVIEEKTNGK